MLAQKLGLSLPTIKTAGGAAWENLYSLNFDGVNDKVRVSDADVFTPNDSGGNRGFSFSFWVKTTQNRMGGIGKVQATQMEWSCNIGTNGHPNFNVYSGGLAANYQTMEAVVSVDTGNWHNVICTWDLTDGKFSQQLFIDGTEYSFGQGNVNYTNGGTWASVSNTGSDLQFAQTGITPFTGNLDEIAIFDDVTTQSQATAIYNSGTPTDLSGETYLVGYWRNGDTAGTSVYPIIEDYSSNSNDGTMTNMTSGDIETDVP